MPDGDGYCLCTTVNVKLLQDMLDMVADGVGGNYEALSNVACAEAFRQERQNLSFARSELFEQRPCLI
jgi:hypothetical protein